MTEFVPSELDSSVLFFFGNSKETTLIYSKHRRLTHGMDN